MRCAIVAICLVARGAVAGADPAPAPPVDLPHATAILRYGNPDAPLVIELSDIARRGAASLATTTLLPLVDKHAGLVALRWQVTSRGTPADDRAASALLAAAAQANPWCYVRRLAEASSPEELQTDQFATSTLLAAAQACHLDLATTERAIDRLSYRAVVPRQPPEARALQRLSVAGRVVTRNINSEVGELVERLARGQVLHPAEATRQALIGRSRHAYERPALRALPVPAASASTTATDITKSAPGGFAMISPAQPRWDVQVYCALDAVCQALLGELARLATQPDAAAMRVRWLPLQAMAAAELATRLARPLEPAATTDVTLAVVCAARAGTSPTMLMHVATTAASTDPDRCPTDEARMRARQTTQAYTALAFARGIRHDLALVVNGRLFAGGMVPGALRSMLAEDTSHGVIERLAPWLR